ncbi:hypothetical protein LIER_19446 [Lithospermum erythrorhizon]|uniref:Uncharacterized protein n=1 Tax=Lithospermum erythrorhizon TaxID=34254 RepID=A0AAV3QKE6_LITER
MPETFNHPSPDLLPPATITIPDHTPSLDIVISAQESSPIIPPPKASSSSSGEFLEVLYSLPSGITVTGKTVSREEEPSASLLLKNCMLKGDMEGIMGYSSPSKLQNAFSHFHLKSTECADGLFLKWKESEESRATSKAKKTSLEKRLSEVRREMDETRAQAADLRNKHEDLQAVCNGIVKSKSDLSCKHEIVMAVFKSSLEEFEQRSRDLRAQLNSLQQLLAASEK